MHVLSCMVCKEKTDDGPKVRGKLRPICRTHRAGWHTSGEKARGVRTGDVARAFMDWLNRVLAERRNAVPA